MVGISVSPCHTVRYRRKQLQKARVGSGILLDLALQHGDHLVLRFLTFQPNLILGNGVWKEVEERKAVGERKATGT